MSGKPCGCDPEERYVARECAERGGCRFADVPAALASLIPADLVPCVCTSCGREYQIAATADLPFFCTCQGLVGPRNKTIVRRRPEPFRLRFADPTPPPRPTFEAIPELLERGPKGSD